MKTFKFAAVAVAGLCLTATVPAGAQTAPAPTAAEWRVVVPENLLVIDTSKGRVLVELEPRMAPNHVARIRELADRGFYDGLKFHRVIPDFMAQTGDPLGTGQGSSDLPNLEPEFSFRRGRGSGFQMVSSQGAGQGAGQIGVMGSMVITTQPDAQMFVTADMKTAASGLFCAGVAGMARSSAPNSANSQFFLMTGRNEGLDGQYTPFGRVLQGLDVVRALKAGDRAQDGAVVDPDVMTRVRTAAALPEGQRPTARVVDSASPAFKARVDAARASGATDACQLQPAAEISGG